MTTASYLPLRRGYPAVMRAILLHFRVTFHCPVLGIRQASSVSEPAGLVDWRVGRVRRLFSPLSSYVRALRNYRNSVGEQKQNAHCSVYVAFTYEANTVPHPTCKRRDL